MSLSHRELKNLRALNRKKQRLLQGCFLIEGLRLTREALFSNAVIASGSSVVGDIECWWGGDAFCEDPGNVWGAYGCPSIPWFSAPESEASPSDSRSDLLSLRRELRALIEEERFE